MLFILLFFTLAVTGLESQSLWRDEALSIGRIQQPLVKVFANRNIVQGIESPDLHPPLYFLLLRIWTTVAGTSEFALRYPSTMLMILSLALFAAVGQKIWSRETGVWAVVLASFSPFYLWYAQEVRMYTLIVLLALLFIYTFWPLLLGRGSAKQFILCGFSAGALVYTHYSGLFLIGFALIAYLIVRFNHLRRKWPLLIFLGFMLLVIPLYKNILELLSSQGFIAFQRRPLWDLFREAINTFSLGSTVPLANPGWRLLPFIILLVIGIPAFSLAKTNQRKKVILLSFGGFTITLLLFYIASWLQANYSNPRHLTILSPFLYLLMAQGLTTIRRFSPLVAVPIAVAIIVAASMSIWQTIYSPPMVRDDVRSLAAYIEERALPGDAVLWHDAVMMQTYSYYASDIPFEAVPIYGQFDAKQAAKQVQELVDQYERIWFVQSPNPPFFDDQVVPGALSKNFFPVDRTSFPASWASLNLKLFHSLTEDNSGLASSTKVDLSSGPYFINGWALHSDPLPGEGVWLTIYWSFHDEPNGDPLNICIKLIDSTDVVWTSTCTQLVVPDQFTASKTSLFSQQSWLPLPRGLAPTTYTVQFDTGDTLVEAGSLEIDPTPFSDNIDNIAKFTNGITLLDFDWAAEKFRAGLWLVGYPLWNASGDIDPGLKIKLRLVDILGRTVAETSSPLGPQDFPLLEWQPDEVVRDFIGLQIPFDAAGRHRLQIAIVDGEGNIVPRSSLIPGRKWAAVGWIDITGWPLVLETPSDASLLDRNVMFGDQIILEGYQLTRDSDILTVDLYWGNQGKIEEELGVFVHVGNPGEVPVYQSSGEPANWTRPTSTWREDEIIYDQHTFDQLSPDDGSQMQIFVGFYNLDNPNLRLEVTDSGQNLPGGAFRLSNLPDPAE